MLHRSRLLLKLLPAIECETVTCERPRDGMMPVAECEVCNGQYDLDSMTQCNSAASQHNEHLSRYHY